MRSIQLSVLLHGHNEKRPAALLYNMHDVNSEMQLYGCVIVIKNYDCPIWLTID